MAGFGAGGGFDGFVALLHFGDLILGRHVAEFTLDRRPPRGRTSASISDGLRLLRALRGRRFSVDAIAHGEECGLCPWSASTSSTAAVDSGQGPSSNVSATTLSSPTCGERFGAPRWKLLHDFFRRQAGDRAGFRALQSVGALPLEHVDRSAPFLFDRVGDAFLGGFARLFDGAAVASSTRRRCSASYPCR